MGFRKGGGGGGGGVGGGANIRTIILGVITIVIGLIMLGIAVDVIDPLLDGQLAAYPGAEAMLGLFPLLMLIALVLFGGILIWIGYGGGAMGIRGTIMTTIVVVVAIILLPVVVETLIGLEESAIEEFAGLEAFLGLIPMLYVIGVLFITGMMGYGAVRGKLPTRATFD